MIEKIEWNNKILAIVLRSNYDQDGVNFITSSENPFQIGVLKHSQGVKIKPHIHRTLPRNISEVQEVLHVQYGRISVDFYDTDGKEVSSVILNSEDTILLMSGGHGFNILEDTKIIEVKQGPYLGLNEDKIRIVGSNK